MVDLSLALLAALTVLDILLFQQVYLHLLLDLEQLQRCQQGDCAAAAVKEPDKPSAIRHFLAACALVNLLLQLTNFVFVYVERRRRGHGHTGKTNFICGGGG